MLCDDRCPHRRLRTIDRRLAQHSSDSLARIVLDHKGIYAVDVAEGFVGVVKSNVIDSVHFGNLVVDKPNSCQQKMV